jgi:hypothetical protein
MAHRKFNELFCIGTLVKEHRLRATFIDLVDYLNALEAEIGPQK